MASEYELDFWLDDPAVAALETDVLPMVTSALDMCQEYLSEPGNRDLLEKAFALISSAAELLGHRRVSGCELLAESLAGFMAALLEDRLDQDQKSLAGLGSGILAMRRYVGFVVEGGRDVPLLAIADVNALRRSAGQQLLREHAAYHTLELEFCHSARMRIATEAVSPEVAGRLAVKMAALFQHGLLALLKDRPDEKSWNSMTQAARGMARHTPSGPNQRGWLLVEMVIACFASGGLTVNFARKRTLSEVAKLFPRMGWAESVEQQGPPAELERELLFLLSLSARREGVVKRFIEAAAIRLCKPNDADFGRMAERLGGPDADTLIAVAREIQLELESCEEAIEVVAGRGDISAEEARQLSQQVKACANVVRLINFRGIADLLEQAAQALSQLEAGESEQLHAICLDAAELMIVARQKIAALGSDPDDAQAAGDRREPLVSEARRQAMKELLASLQRLQQGNENPTVEAPADTADQLAAVADVVQLSTLGQALQGLSLYRPGTGENSLLTECCNYLKTCLEQGDGNDAALLEAMMEAQ